jgi:hypothetical protein
MGLEVIKKLCPNTDFIGIREYCILNEMHDHKKIPYTDIYA